MNEEIKPCPNVLCKSKNIRVDKKVWASCSGHTTGYTYQVICNICGAPGRWSFKEQEAIEEWNNRPESAWEMLNRLMEYEDFLRLLHFRESGNITGGMKSIIIYNFIIKYTKQEAIEIMQQIEKEKKE